MNKGKTSTKQLWRWFAVISFVCFQATGYSQLWDEDFGVAGACSEIDTADGAAATLGGNFTVTYGTSYTDTLNNWRISARESFIGVGNCGDGCLNTSTLTDKALHLTQVDPSNIDIGAKYNNSTITDATVWTPAINTTGAASLKLRFDYIEGSNDPDDEGLVYISVGGTGSPVLIDSLIKPSTSCTTGEWAHFETYLDAFYLNQFQIHIGFRWVNDGDNSGTNPSFAVDNIALIDTVPTANADISVDSICNGESVDFSSDSTLGVVTTYAWSFGSNATPSTSILPNPSNIVFNGIGIYPCTLSTTNANGTSIDIVTIEVIDCYPPTPVIDVNDQTLCQGQAVNFADSSIAGAFGKGQWVWQFQGGIPNTSTQQHPQNIVYNSTGVYNVTLTVVDTATGADSTIIFPGYITVGTCAVPNAIIARDDTAEICHNDFVEFYSLSTGEPDSATWIFPGGNPAIITHDHDTVDTIEVLYPTPGVYDVILVVWNGAGTSVDTMHDWVTVLNCPVPKARFDVSSRVICPGVAVVFQDLSIDATEWYWEFPGAVPSTSTDQHPTDILYPNPGSYAVTLVVKNVNGEDTLIREAYIRVDSCLPPDPRFEVERDSICRQTCVQFFNTSLRTDSLFWIFWWHPYTDSITGTIVDTITSTTNQYGWLAGDTHFVVHRDFFPVFDTVFMEQDPIYCWDDSGTVGLQLFTFNQYDVSVLNQQDVPVLNIGGKHPTIDAGPDRHLLMDNIESRFYLEDTTSFNVTGTAPYFNWYPEEDLSCYDCPNPIVYPTSTRKYFVTNYDDYGCQVYDSVAVYIDSSYYAGIPNIFSPNADGTNDILWVRGNSISSKGFKFRIWNRYGQEVFTSNIQNDGWDGTYKEAPAASGSYKYYVKVTFENGVVEELTGNVTLVRY